MSATGGSSYSNLWIKVAGVAILVLLSIITTLVGAWAKDRTEADREQDARMTKLETVYAADISRINAKLDTLIEVISDERRKAGSRHD